MKLICRVLFLVCTMAVAAQAVPVTFVVRSSVELPAEAAVYLAGNFQNWQPGAARWQLSPVGGGLFRLTADFEVGQGLQFKFTRGSWLAVEKGTGGEEIPNRLHVVAGPDTLTLQVEAWADGQPEHRAHTITGRVGTFSRPDFLDGRRVWVYLPPGYDQQPEQRYPVFYMFDGQNVFDNATSFVGEWQVDETLELLIANGSVAPLIVVAVDNGGDLRLKEYTPWAAPNHWDAGGGKDHLQQWVAQLLPHINERYRTLTGPQYTGLAGSSLGGLMSLYGGFAHGDVFGKIGVFSPTTHVPRGRLFEYCAEASPQPQTIYLDMGTRENGNLTDEDKNGTDDHIDAVRHLAAVLSRRGYVGGWDLLVVEDEGAIHNEQAWARRFPAAVEFLFPPE